MQAGHEKGQEESVAVAGGDATGERLLVPYGG